MTGGKPRRRPWLELYRNALDSCGVPWRVEEGTKHDKVFVGDIMVFVISRGPLNEQRRYMEHQTRRNIQRAADAQR